MNMLKHWQWSAAVALVVATAGSLAAEDIVERKNGASPLRGEIAGSTRTDLTLKVPSKPEVKVPANEIARVRFNGEKPQLNLVRSEESAGRLREALEGYRQASQEVSPTQSGLKTDLEFLIARTTAKLSQVEPALRDEAATKLTDFLKAHPDHFRFYEAQLLLGNVQLARNDLAAAREAFNQLAQAPWNDTRVLAKNAAARVLLAEDKVDEALSAYQAVLAAAGTDAAGAAGRFEALLGQATCLEKKGDFTQAATVLERILEEASDDDVEIQAEASVRLGNCLQAAGKIRDALLAYLRVDVLFFKEKAYHAEALYHLSQLWARDGKPDRAADAATALQAKYPDSEWAKKVSSPPR